MTCLSDNSSSVPSTSRRANSSSDAVLLTATELFVSRETHDAREIAIYRELALNLLPQTRIEDRRHVASILVRHPCAPQELLSALAADEDTLTAYPVLRNTAYLSEEILTQQARSGADSLCKAIVEQSDLSAPVLQALAENGSLDVISALMNRTDVNLSDALVASLCKRPGVLAMFGDELRNRDAISSNHLMGHFCRLSGEMRNEAIAAAELANLVDLTRSGSHKPARAVFKPRLLNHLHHSAMADSPDEFARELAYALSLPEDFTRYALIRDSGETLAISLKALGFKSARAGQVMVRHLGDRTSLGNLRTLIDVFRNITDGAAMILVNRWISVESTAADKPSTQHQPLHQDSRPARKPTETLWQEINDIEKLLRIG
ncbi:DUF2336 domain-containing protein [Roseibium algae]|uniref:DUF2336 domain-containing protein n=1 Tax=Roseibium algae TaxID=3123038 RepID=A0ABU8TJY0_9HYPH